MIADRHRIDAKLGAASLAGSLAFLAFALTRVAERAFDARFGVALLAALAVALAGAGDGFAGG